MIWHVTFSSSRLSCSFDSCSVEVNVVASDKAYDKKRDFATERVNESIEAQPTGPTKDQNLKIQRCFKLQDLASTFWDMTFGHICWFASLIAAWSLTAVAWAWWTTKRHTTGKFHKTLPEDFLGFSSQNSPWTQDVTMFSLKQWFGNNTIQGTSTYIKRTSTYHTVSHSVTGELKNSKTVLQCGGPWIDQDPEASKWIKKSNQIHQIGSRIKKKRWKRLKKKDMLGRTPDLVRLERLDFLCGLQELLKKTRCAKFFLFFYSQIKKKCKNL